VQGAPGEAPGAPPPPSPPAGEGVADAAAAAASQGTPPPFPADGRFEGAPGRAVMRDSVAGGGDDGVEDAVAAALAALDAPPAPGDQPLNLAAAVSDALARDTAEDCLDDTDGGDDCESPIEPGDFGAIVETFFNL